MRCSPLVRHLAILRGAQTADNFSQHQRHFHRCGHAHQCRLLRRPTTPGYALGSSGNCPQQPRLLLYDLAVAANDWCNDSAGVLDTEKVLALLRGYQAVRPLTKHELWFLPSFALYAALTAWLSQLGTKPAAPPGSSQSPDPGSQPSSQGPRFKNPNELQHIVRQHLAHAFYLDERLLT